MCLNHSSTQDMHFWTLESKHTSVFFCAQLVRQCFFLFFFSPLLSSSQLPFISPNSTYFEPRQKQPSIKKTPQSKGSWCLGFAPGVLTAEQQCANTVRCTFTFLFCWCFLSVWPCHPGFLHISQHVSFITALFFLYPFFFSSCVSWHFLSVSHPLHTQITLSCFLFWVRPVILWISVGVLFRPISPISWCWEGDGEEWIGGDAGCSAWHEVRVCGLWWIGWVCTLMDYDKVRVCVCVAQRAWKNKI